MFRYYFLLGVRNLRRNPVLTALMVLTLAIGVADVDGLTVVLAFGVVLGFGVVDGFPVGVGDGVGTGALACEP